MQRADLVFMANCAEQAERYDEMVNHIKKVAELGLELTVEERNLLTVAYRNFVGSRRASWRVLDLLLKEQEPGSARIENVRYYREKIGDEIRTICRELVSLLDDHCIPASQYDESKVFNWKLRGDYYRYLAEISTGEDQSSVAEKADASYTKAMAVSVNLATTHPIRLGLALNYSVFLFEIAHDCDRACSLSKDSFEDAIEDLDSLSESEYREATLVMQLLKDNLTLWMGEDDDDDGDLEEAEDEDSVVPSSKKTHGLTLEDAED